MSRTAVTTRDTPRPGAVTVTCDNCGGGFVTDESTARQADQHDEDLLCKPCKNGQPAPPSEALEEPEIDAIREDLQHTGVGPDAEPPVEASVPDSIGFGDLETDAVAHRPRRHGGRSMNSADVELAVACIGALAWIGQTAVSSPVEAVILLGIMYLTAHLTQRFWLRHGRLRLP
ncbi:hypothetical protein ACOJIV_18320 [Haloarcula sp. AONF1]